MKNYVQAISLPSQEEAIIIGKATTSEEKREVYRLRYRIYAEEISYKLVNVDHVNKLLYDDLDGWGTVFYAKIGSEYIGTVRVNIGQISDFSSEIVETYSMDRFLLFYNGQKNYNFGLASKGMVAPSCRKLPVFSMLMTKVFEEYCDNQVHFGFGNSNFYLLPLYEHYGYRRIGKNTVEPSFGVATSFVIIPEDIHHLKKVNSPFLNSALAKGKRQNNSVVKWFRSQFSETANIANSQLISEEKLWTTLRVRLGHPPNEVMPILAGLSQAAAKKLLSRCSVVVQCPKGSYIVTREDVSQEITILLSGELYSNDSPDVNQVIPGQHFGGNGIPNRTKHSNSVMAATDTEILVLSYHFFLKFRRSYPDIADKILQNLN